MKSLINPQVDSVLALTTLIFSAYWFAAQNDAKAFGILICLVLLATHFVQNYAAAIASAIALTFLFRFVQGVHEGMETKAPAKKEPKAVGAKDAFTEMLGSANDGNLEELMKRQTVLMSQLKDMAPLMQSAKEALRQLPAGYLDKALKTLKTNMKENPVK